jgi:hypothetical protein
MNPDAVALIPVLDEPRVLDRLTQPLGDHGALARTIESIRHDLPQMPIVLTTDSYAVRDYVRQHFPNVQLHARTTRDYVLSLVGALDVMERDPVVALVVEATHPFRPAGLVRKLASALASRSQLDSVVCVRQLRGNLWQVDADGGISAAQETDTPIAPQIFFQELVGLGLATRPSLLRAGRRLGDSVGFEVVDDIWSLTDVRDDRGVRRAQSLVGLLSPLEVV